LEKHENASDDVWRRRYVQRCCFLVGGLRKEAEGNGPVL